MVFFGLLQSRGRSLKEKPTKTNFITVKKGLPSRAIIFPKDVENITGLSNRSARRLLQKVRIVLGKKMDQFILIKDFCEVTGIKEEIVREYL